VRIRRFIKSFRYGQKGFTLIELLVVVAILGILAAIVVPNFTQFLGTGSNEAACIEQRMVQTGAVAYAADHDGNCPTAIVDLSGYFEGSIDGTYTFTAGGDCAPTQTAYPGTAAGCVE